MMSRKRAVDWPERRPSTANRIAAIGPRSRARPREELLAHAYLAPGGADRRSFSRATAQRAASSSSSASCALAPAGRSQPNHGDPADEPSPPHRHLDQHVLAELRTWSSSWRAPWQAPVEPRFGIAQRRPGSAVSSSEIDRAHEPQALDGEAGHALERGGRHREPEQAARVGESRRGAADGRDR